MQVYKELLNADQSCHFLNQPIGATIRHNDTDILFTLDPSGYISFQVSGLCKAFDMKPDIFETIPQETCMLEETEKKTGENDIFVSELDIFSSPMGNDSRFKTWYFGTAISMLRDFSVRFETETKKRYIQDLNNLLRKTKNALNAVLNILSPEQQEMLLAMENERIVKENEEKMQECTQNDSK